MPNSDLPSRAEPYIEDGAEIGIGAQIWAYAQIRTGAKVGAETTVGKDVFVDHDVSIGARCKIQNGVKIYHQAILDDGVFIGPGVVFTNDRYPRAINPDGSQKSAAEWTPGTTRIGHGASVGAGTIILPGTQIGAWAMVGAGALVTKNVLPHALMTGSPAVQVASVCACGQKLNESLQCSDPACGIRYELIDGEICAAS